MSVHQTSENLTVLQPSGSPASAVPELASAIAPNSVKAAESLIVFLLDCGVDAARDPVWRRVSAGRAARSNAPISAPALGRGLSQVHAMIGRRIFSSEAVAGLRRV